MAGRDHLAAKQLLAALHADGCTLTVENGQIRAQGRFTNARWAALQELKAELLELLTAATANEPVVVAVHVNPRVQAEIDAGVPPDWASLGEDAVPSLLPPGTFLYGGVIIPGPELRRWQQQCADAMRDNRPPPPRPPGLERVPPPRNPDLLMRLPREW
jgi:hypothetical protein